MGTISLSYSGQTSPAIRRHLTAIRRNNLSRPVQLLLETGALTRDRTFLDYGCGFGDDIRILAENGYSATGWDPHFAPHCDKRPSDVVNLGFVLNVIEDVSERRAVLQEAYELSGSVLSVGVMYAVDANRASGVRLADGILTQKQTFQRLYNQEELSEFVRSATTDRVMPVAPGVAFAFKDEEQHRRFRYGRVHRHPISVIIPKFTIASAADHMQRLAADYPAEWDSYVEFLGDRGRPPAVAESTFIEKAQSRRIRSNTVFSWAIKQIGADRVEEAARQTKDDLLVFMAMSLFENRARMSDLDSTARADVKHFYGSFSNAMSHAHERLLSVGDAQLIRKLAESSTVGMVKDNGLFLRPRDVNSLPLALRLYVMLGTLFFGSVDAADIIKVHLTSNKLTFYVVRDKENESRTRQVYDAFKVDFVKRRVTTYEYLMQPDRLEQVFEENQ